MTTAFAQIVSDVSIATARADLVATGDIGLAIRRATLKMHSMAFWPRDIAEGIILFADATLRNQSIGIVQNLDRFRAIKYIREYFPNLAVTSPIYDREAYYTKQEPDAILDDYGTNMTNIWYLGGSNINLRGRIVSTTNGQGQFPANPIINSAPGVTVGWYQHPKVADVLTFESWIADTYPFAIVDEACRMIFKSTGNLDMAKAYDDIMREHHQFMIQNFIDGEGR